MTNPTISLTLGLEVKNIGESNPIELILQEHIYLKKKH